ncbi:transposase [Paenibacillus elgii]
MNVFRISTKGAECEGHALCNTHHHRELNGIIENDQQQWPEKMIGLLYEIKGAVEQAKADGWNSLMPEYIAYFENRYEQVIQLGHSENPSPPPPDAPKKKGRVKQSKAKNLLDRMKNRNAVLAFMYNLRIPFTNNEAERIIRMVKRSRKCPAPFAARKGRACFAEFEVILPPFKDRSCRFSNILGALWKASLSCPRFEPSKMRLAISFRGTPYPYLVLLSGYL